MSTIIDRIQAAFPINRIVALLAAPFAAVAGGLAAWLGAHFPGLPPLDPNWLAGIFSVAAASAATLAYKWLDGWQKNAP